MSGASYTEPEEEPEVEDVVPPLSVDEVEISNEESFGDLSYSKTSDDDSYDLDTTASSDEEWERKNRVMWKKRTRAKLR